MLGCTCNELRLSTSCAYWAHTLRSQCLMCAEASQLVRDGACSNGEGLARRMASTSNPTGGSKCGGSSRAEPYKGCEGSTDQFGIQIFDDEDQLRPAVAVGPRR